MKMKQRFVHIVLASTMLSACGTSAPSLPEAWDQSNPKSTYFMEVSIKRAIWCELARSIYDLNSPQNIHVDTAKGSNYLIPPSWGVQITLTLEVDETTGLSPGLTLMTPAVKIPFSSVGLGGTLSSQAFRTDKFNFFYTVQDLMKPLTDTSTCNDRDFGRNYPTSSSPFTIVSALGIGDWLRDAGSTNDVLPSSVVVPTKDPKKKKKKAVEPTKSDFKPDTLSYELKFIVISSGSVTPSWKLVRLSANTGNAPFLNLNRTRTHDLLITLGPTSTSQLVGDAGRLITVPVPSKEAANSHLASEIGVSVANNVRNSGL